MSDNDEYRLNDWLERTLCDVLEEMRKCDKTRNYSALQGLIEEAQSYGNDMESALGAQKKYREWKRLKKKLKDEIKQLKKKKEQLDVKSSKTRQRKSTT